MAKTMKVIDVHDGAFHYTCIKDFGAEIYRYRLYRMEWQNGSWHRKQVGKYECLLEALSHLNHTALHTPQCCVRG